MELLPTTANPFKLHRQAKRILRSTSRARNPDWYARANTLDLQWHIWVGPHQVVSAIFHRSSGQWFEGPTLPAVSLETDENDLPVSLDDDSRNRVHEMLRQILSTKQFGGKPKSLGVVFHLGDGIRVRELAPDFASDTNFDTVDQLLASAPDVALGDDSVDNNEGSWHVFPLLGVEEGDKRSLAVQVSAQYRFIVECMRDYGELRNIPIVVEVLSAALESIAALPLLHPEGGKFEHTIALIQFDSFSLLCATGRQGSIQLIRPLAHRMGTSLSPADVADVIANTAALLDLKDPEILIVSMSGSSREDLDHLLEPYLEANPEAKTGTVDATAHPAVETVPGRRFELAFLAALAGIDEEPKSPVEKTRERWAIQDFCGLTNEEIARIPTRGDLRMLRFAGHSHKLAIVALMIFCGWTGMDFFSKMTTEEWKLPPNAAEEMQLELVKLQKEKNEWQHWQNLLAKRSEGWVAMEALLSIFPDDGGVVLNKASYSARGGQAEGRSEKIGFARKWSVSGYANPKIATDLSSLGSRSRVQALMNEIAEKTRADYLETRGDTRELKVSFLQKQGTMPPTNTFPVNVARHFRTAFELGIDQDISEEDELAIQIEAQKSE